MSEENRRDQNLRVEDRGAIRVLTMNRPERRNAIDVSLYTRLAEELERAAVDDGVRAVVVTGAGVAFSAGADRSAGAQDYDGPEPHPFFRFVAALALPKPLIGAVNGVAVGIGVTMLAHFDIVVVDPAARLRLPFTALGVAPEAGSSYLIQAIMGQQRAARYLLTSEWIDAGDAVLSGLATERSEPGASLDRALEFAETVAAFSLPSLMATKRSLLATRQDAVTRALADERRVWEGLKLAPMKE